MWCLHTIKLLPFSIDYSKNHLVEILLDNGETEVFWIPMNENVLKSELMLQMQMINNKPVIGKHIITTNIKNMSRLFEDNTTFNDSINEWDTSNVTDMSMMFKNAINFNTNIQHWNTSNVTDMTSMFENAKSFNQSLSTN